MTLEQLLKAAERNNRAVDRQISGFIAELRLLMQRSILRELSQLPQDRTLRQREVIRLLGGLESIAVNDRVVQHIESVSEIFDYQSEVMSELFSMANKTAAPDEISRRTRSNIAIFTNAREQNIRIMAQAYANEVRQALADSIITGDPVSDFNLSEVSAERIFKTLDTDLKTATATYSRIISLEQARQSPGEKLVLYFGPKDDKNRPFCAERVGNVYPMEEVYTWDNGQGLPAHLYCGGYNCRHMLLPVGKDYGA